MSFEEKIDYPYHL